jgi:2-amino-4-hydroxy-6-hydroxymethyldihydropteridine diphosphokinase
MPRCLIGLGANLGEPAETLRAALDALARHPGIEFVAASSFLETKPIGGPVGQGTFLNACATIRTERSPRETIQTLLEIEASLGRTRRTRWEARKLDLDLLLYGDAVCREQGVEIPHPRMASRRFVLDPAAEIAGGMIHPTTGWTIGAMARHLREAPNVAMLTGLAVDQKTKVIRKLEDAMAAGGATFMAFRVPDCDDLSIRGKAVRATFDVAGDVAYPPFATLVILDFWPGESLLWKEQSLPDEEQILSLLAEQPAPKLLIDLYVPGEDAALAERWGQILRAHAPAPWIRVNAAHPEAAETEIVAALQAMQG